MNMKLCEATRDMLRRSTLLGFIKLHVLFKAVQGRSKDAELVRTPRLAFPGMVYGPNSRPKDL